MANPIAFLNDLEDVSVPAPNDEDILYYDATASLWKAQAPPPAGYDEGTRVYHNIDFAIPNASWTSQPLNSERYDTDTIHDTVTNNSRLTCKTAGVYIIVGHITFDKNATGLRYSMILLNNTTRLCQCQLIPSAASDTFLNLTTIYELAVNEYLELQVYQNSGGVLLSLTHVNRCPEFMMQRIG